MTTFIDALLPSVHDILSVREALSKLANCERHIKTQGPTSIIENFTVVYSCLHHAKALKQETIDEILHLLIKGMTLLEADLKKILGEKLATDLRIKYLNSLKMFMYLTVEFTNFVEKQQTSSKDGDLLAGSTKKGKKAGAAGSKKNADISLSGADGAATFDWNDMKEKILDCIAKIVLLNIQKLWDPPIAEEQFVISITNLCYKLMETFANSTARSNQKKVIKDHLCHILGIMIKKYNHSYGACVMIMQTLPHYEHLGAMYADLIKTCVIQLGYEAILPDILREFRHTNLNNQANPGATGAAGVAGAGAGKSADNNPNLKFYSQFIIDLADSLAPQLQPYMSLIQDFLDDDSYLMRNAILHLYGEIIVKVLNQDATDKDLKLKQMRNELLDTLCDHIHDVNAMARSRTLQIWRHICEEKAIPLHYMNEVMKRCIGRMEDVASSVRKSAFQLLCDLIRKNPFGIKSIEMSLEQIEAECVKEEAALAKLKDDDEKLVDAINKELENAGGEEEQEEETTAGQESARSGTQESTTDLQQEQQREKQQQMIIIQTSKVNYLKDMLSFVKQLEAAIPKISKLLFSKTQTDVLEVISFFVTCYEHGLNDMLFGIRKMLSLVMYAEKTVKDAVVNAYKRLYLSPSTGGKGAADNAASPIQIAKQLIKLTQDLTICERDALEELIGEFASSGELDNAVIQVLWEIFANVEMNPQNRLNALILLGMVIKKIPEKGRANIQVLIDFGLSVGSSRTSSSADDAESDDQAANEEEEEDNMDMETDEIEAGQGRGTQQSKIEYDMLRFSETCLALSYISLDTNTKKLTQQDTNATKPAESQGRKKGGNKEDGAGAGSGSSKKKEPHLQFNNEPFKLPNSHQLFERIVQVLGDQFSNSGTIYWTTMAENALQCIMKLADNPVLISETIALKLIEKVPPLRAMTQRGTAVNARQLPPVPLFNEETIGASQQSTAAAAAAANDQILPSQLAAGGDESTFKASSAILSRFFSFVGLLSIKLLIFLNQYVVCELKRRKMCKENNENSSSSSKSKTSTSNNNSNAASSSKSKRRQSMKLLKGFNTSGDMAALEEEMGLQGAEAEDVELLLIESIIEQKVIVSQPGNTSLIAQIIPIIVAILKEPAKYNDDTLQLSCSLALVKIMLLSQKLCTQYSQLLFTLMEKSPNPTIRSQLILGIGDLVYRFPNAMEPWTSHLYLPLRDRKSKPVRMNTIRVLSHLILKEMIKTRGQLYEIALCTIDDDAQISALSKLFFQELSQRNNGLVIYNAMPDMISNLSGGGVNGDTTSANRALDEESFRTIATYLFTFIKRDKQCETLIEKICSALRQANNSERKSRDLVFCLSKLQLSENGIKKLKETFKWYADKLCIPYVYDTFKQVILKNARKLPTLKNETKMMIDELEKQIEEVRQKGLDNDKEGGGDGGAESETAVEQPTQSAPPSRAAAAAAAKKTKTASRKAKDTSDEESEEEEQPVAQTQRARRGHPAASQPKAMTREEIVSKFGAKKGQAPAKKPAPAPPTRGRRVVVEEEDESNEDSDENESPNGVSDTSSGSSDSD